MSCGIQTTPSWANSTLQDSHFCALLVHSLVNTTWNSLVLSHISVNKRGFWKSRSLSALSISSTIGFSSTLFCPFLFFFSFGFSPARFGILAWRMLLALPYFLLKISKNSGRVPIVSATARTWGQRPAVLWKLRHLQVSLLPLTMTFTLLPNSVTQYMPPPRSITLLWERLISASCQICVNIRAGTLVTSQSSTAMDRLLVGFTPSEDEELIGTLNTFSPVHVAAQVFSATKRMG